MRVCRERRLAPAAGGATEQLYFDEEEVVAFFFGADTGGVSPG